MMSIPYTTHNEEWRRAYDGCPYTFGQFLQWYGQAAAEVWNDAPEVRQFAGGIWYTNEESSAMSPVNPEITAAEELDQYILDGLQAMQSQSQE